MKDVLVLGYHAVSEEWSSDLAVTPDELHGQLASLLERGYEGAQFQEAVRNPLAAKTLAVTFDDAYRSVIELALPIFRQLGLPGTVFVPTEFASGGLLASWAGVDTYLHTAHAHELAVMSWEELAELSSLGWEIGSHTRSHPRLTQLPDAALTAELQASRDDCEQHLEQPCRSIAFPYGDVDSRVTAATSAAGYLTAAGLPRFNRLHQATALNWPRIGIFNGDARVRFRLKVSPLGRRLRTLASRADPSLPDVVES